MHAPFAQNPRPSYRVLPHTPEDVRIEQYFPLADYQSSRSSTIRHPQDFPPGAPHIPTPSWDSEGSSATRVGDIALNEMRESPDSSRFTATPAWLPYTLRWPCLTLILIFTAVLEILVVIIHAMSAREMGLVADDGSGSIIILSKFVPTLLAVVHGIFLSILLNDVKRTQAFANLASPSGASAKLSLTWTADAWWESLIASLPKRHTKNTSWAMLCTTMAFIFSFLIVSPFSSTLLVSQDVLFKEEVAFSQLDISSALPLQASPIATTYFRTVSNILQNVTTSAWITDSYAVLPFWPSTVYSVPLGPMISDSVQTWSAKTMVFDVEMNCEQMDLVELAPLDWFDPEFNGTVPSYRVRLLSPSGCALNLTLPDFGTDLSTYGGAVWSALRSINITDFTPNWDSPFGIGGCTQDEIIFLSKPLSQATAANATVIGQACKTNYYMGDPSVTVTLSKSSSLVEINELEYSSIRKPIPSTVADLSSFQRVFLNNTNWSMHLKTPLRSQRAFASGPAILLSALYDFSPEQMVSDASFIQNLGRVKQRFFGELLRDVFDTASDGDTIKAAGTIVDTRRRVVVVSSVAIVLEVSLFLQILLLSTVLITTRLSRRPLGLFVDPAPPIRVAKLISSEAGTLQSLDSLHSTSSKELALSLSEKKYLLSRGQVRLMAPEGPEGLPNMSTSQKQGSYQHTLLDSTHPDNQSYAFSIWMFIILVSLLSTTLTAIAYLYWYSDAVGLHQTAFVYAFDISVGGVDLGNVNPASLITTTVAVSIGLWWGSLDTALRRIQPYLVLAKRPITRSGSEGVLISYISSYLLWAAWRAMKRCHWVLALVCTGAFLSEILTIAMSSLWAREVGALPSVVNVLRQLELRHVPQLSAGAQFRNSAGGYKQIVLSELFTNMRTSWIYGAAVQTSLNGSEPPWSSGGWSFVPYDLSMVPSTTLQNTGNQTRKPEYSMNATVDTSAIRARLECSPHEHLNLEDSKTWLTEWDLSNATQWDRETSTKTLSRGFELGLSDVGDNTMLYLDRQSDDQGNYTTFFVNNKRFQCCQNKTNGQIGSGSVGYWSPNLQIGSLYPDFDGTWPVNFTVKWIYGLPVEGYCGILPTFECVPRLMWAEKPRMAALNCMPIIETANATVTVNAADGRVVNFALHGEPRLDDYAWSNDFEKHQYDNTTFSLALNITTSHGILFLTALLGAADLDIAQDNNNLYYHYIKSESIDDQTFNIRQSGLNVDLMTYSMLSLVNYDHEALLDLEILKGTAQQTFTALFQNFASNNISFANGGYVFQSPGEKLPDDLDGPANESSEAYVAPVNETVTMHISRSVELLKISKPAAWICLLILAYLILVGVILTIASRTYPTVLLRRINSIADVAVLMAGSHRLLKLAREKAVKDLRLDPNTRVRLDWFNDKNGTMRWGIEVVGEEPEVTTLLNDNTTQLRKDNSVGAMGTTSSSALQHQPEDLSLAPSVESQSGIFPPYKPGQVRHRGHAASQQGVEADESRFLMPVGFQATPHLSSGTRMSSIAPSIDLDVDETSFSDYFMEDIYLRPLNSEQDSLIPR